MRYRSLTFVLVFALLPLTTCNTGSDSVPLLAESASLVLGQPNFESASNNAGATASEAAASSLSGPRSVYLRSGRLYVVDTNNNRVLIWNSAPSINQQEADIVLGQANFTDNSPNRGDKADCNTLSFPTAVQTMGTWLFIADSGNSRVLAYKDVDAISTGDAADFVIGHDNCTETRENFLNDTVSGVRNDTLNNPRAVYYDGNDLYIADTDNHRVLIYEGTPSGNGHVASVVIGHINMDDSALKPVAADTFNKPQGVFVTGDQILVSDTENNRVLIFKGIPAVNNASAAAVIGQTDFVTNSAGATQTKLTSPIHIHANDDDRLLIADSENHRVMVYDVIPLSNGEKANEIIGQPNFTSSAVNRGEETDSDGLNSPTGVFINAHLFWIADRLNHRVLRF